MSRVFISYRRDDAAGYAGRLEETLEARLGRGSVFRDVLDIAPGADFVADIRQRLAQADAVLVLIGPRWSGVGESGARRIDDPGDLVRAEIAAALGSGARVIPVLLSGTTMPSEAELPAQIKALARRNALVLDEANWSSDIARLVEAVGAGRKRSRWTWIAAAVALVVCAAAALLLVPALTGGTRAADALVGTWTGTVRYDWGDRYEETFEFKRHAGELTGTASFLGYPRPIESLRLHDIALQFVTHSVERLGESEKEMTHSYAAELRGDVLAFRVVITGGHTTHQPIEFEARRAGGVPPK